MAQQPLTSTATNASYQIALINEHITGPPAEELLRRCGLFEKQASSEGPVHLLDNASGIGTLIFRLLAADTHRHLDKLIGADIDENYLAFLRQRATDTGFSSIVEAIHLDQQTPGLDSESVNYIFNNFGVFFSPQDDLVVAETYRMLKSGGIAGFTTWNKISWWDEILLPAFDQYLPEAPGLPHPGQMFPKKGWSEVQSARGKLETAGFVEVQSEAWSFTPDISAADFAKACAHLVKTISARAWEESAREKFEPQIENALLEYLNNTFVDGRWTGTMTAILTSGKK